jgi:hypothetical protein
MNIFLIILPLATIAQLVEHRFCKPTVISSSLIGGSTIIFDYELFNYE